MTDRATPRSRQAVLLEVARPAEVLPDPQGLPARTVGQVRAVDDVELRRQRGRDAGAGRRERLRQDHDVALHPARASTPTGGRDPAFARTTAQVVDLARAAASASCGRCGAQMQMIFQDPFSSLNPRMTLLRHRRRAAAGQRRGQPRASAPSGSRELLRLVGLRPEYMHRFPHAFSRRPAPAHRHRARARAQSAPGRGRRAGLRAGRVGPGADPEPAARAAGPAGAHLSCSSRTTCRWCSTSATASP